MEMGEGSASAKMPEEQPTNSEKIQIRFSVFFDGTLNNRTNIDQRLVSSSDDKLTEEERKLAAELKEKMSPEDIQKAKGIYKKYEGQGSYENGYTNIAKMERHVDTTSPPAGYQSGLKSYIEGPGTRDVQSDKMLGFAVGVGISGVKKKVEKGVLDVVKKIAAKHADRNVIIEKLTLDTFGFSRGAAAARNFIHEALLEADSIAQRLKDKGYKVDQVVICFAGLYDTVASHGIKFSDDTAALKLNAVTHAKKVIQLAAADEHRENFSLTTITSAGAKGCEIYLPGVHSDIGGSYREGANEDHDIFWTMSASGADDANRHCQELIQQGWYKEGELTIAESRYQAGGGKHSVREVNVRAKRGPIGNQYSRIPLHIMARFVREEGLSFTSRLDKDEVIPDDLSGARREIETHVNNALGQPPPSAQQAHLRAAYWHRIDDKLKGLRHKYFHFSARLSFGNGPRYINGKRQRMYYDG